MSDPATFGDRVLDFYRSFERFKWTEGELALVSPISDARRAMALETFCHKFYADNAERVYCLGINPSRYRTTSTGVPYTDGYALETVCGIANDFDKSRELTATFFNIVVERFGGPELFYGSFYAGAIFPLSILSSKKYRNYYDKDVGDQVREAIPATLRAQCKIGSNRKLIIIGSGDNAKFAKKLNAELGLFDKIWVVEHPRYIMQYKSSKLEYYIAKYIDVYREAVT